MSNRRGISQSPAAGVNTGSFPPSKGAGFLFHGVLLAFLAVVAAWAILNLSSATTGVPFVAYLVLAVLAFSPIPLLSYRLYALFRAQYILDRNSLELRWGLRDEVIPLSDIEWVRPVQDLSVPLLAPALATPGAILGFQRHRDLGIVEFLASARGRLLLVATAKRVYAISPSNPSEFLETFGRAVELGSLRTTKSKSQYPSFVVIEAWHDGVVRFEWLAAAFLNLGLAAWVSLLIPSIPTIAFGLRPDQPTQPTSSLQLVLVPLLSIFLNLIGWSVGLFFYRWGKRRHLARLVWGSGVLSALVFLVAIVFIVGAPG